MNLTRCEKGHFFDEEKFTFCPHCGALAKKISPHPIEPRVVPETIKLENGILDEDLDKPQLDTKISGVNIFENYANVVREGKFTPTQEQTEVYIYGLPYGITPESSVQIETELGMKCTAIDFFHHMPKNNSEEEKEYENLSKEIRKTFSKYITIQEKKKAIYAFMQNRGQFTSDQKEFGRHMKYCTKNAEKIEAEEEEIYQILEDLLKQQKIFEEKKKQTQKENKKSGICLSLTAKPAKEYTIRIQYEVRNATWIPKYNIYSTRESDKLEITLNAEVKNNTGEDWVEVPLTLSVRPKERNLQYQFFDPMTVGDYGTGNINVEFPQEYEFETDPTARFSGDYHLLKTEDISSPENLTGWKNQNSLTEKATSVCRKFEFQTPITVKQGINKRIVLQTNHIDVEKSFFAIPQNSEKEFLGILPTALQDLQMIPCKAEVYYEGKRLQQSVDLARLDKNEIIILGLSDAVKVSRKSVRSEKGIFSFANKKQTKERYEIKVENRMDSPAVLKVLDQIPYKLWNGYYTENVEVMGGKFDKESGLCTWQVQLEPKETKVFVQEITRVQDVSK